MSDPAARAGAPGEAEPGGLLGSIDVDAPEEVAEAAGLVYVSDTQPGIARRRRGRGFSYTLPSGAAVRDEPTLRRIRALAIPPAWKDVWICTDPDGHLQATGWDAKGRKQYRYHPRWRQARDLVKFERLADFGVALGPLRAAIESDLALAGLPKERVVAAVVRLLDVTLIRVGNEEYARANASYGLTTLRDHHADITSRTIRLQFRAKGGKERSHTVTDRRLATIVRRCQDLPGQVLFQYLDDDGSVRAIDSRDVNAYLRERAGGPFTAKDFRTWTATVHVAAALRALCDGEDAPTRTRARQDVVGAVKVAAEALANTPAVCRASYVHPRVIERYLDGELTAIPPRSVRREAAHHPGLSEDEVWILLLLRREQERLAGATADAAAGAA